MKGNRIWLLGTVAVIAIVVVIGYLLGISPKLAEADAAIAQTAEVNAQNAAQQAALVQLQEQYENLDQLEADLADIRKAIPSTQAADAFTQWVASAAAASTVYITKITVGEAAVYGTAPVSEGEPAPTTDGTETTASGPPAAEGVFTLPVSIEVKGSADNVIIFSKYIQLGERLFASSTFTYQAQDSNAILNGFLYIVDDPNSPAFDVPTPEETTEPTPEPTESPTPEPTETPAP